MGENNHQHHGLIQSQHSHNNLMGSGAPPIYEMALVGNWNGLLKRIITNAKEASYTDRRGSAALHLACRRQPPASVVSALLSAYPEATFKTTADGLTPLHFACYCGASVETVRMLVDARAKSTVANPNGGTSNDSNLLDLIGGAANASKNAGIINCPLDRRGRTPLHCACSGFRAPHRPAVVRILLEADPSSSALSDERGRTPLSLMLDDYAEEIEEALTSLSPDDVAKSIKHPSGNLAECWEITSLLLRAAYHGTASFNSTASSNEIDVANKFRFVHAAAAVWECPAAFLRLALKLNPDSAREEDGDFNLPLHVACSALPKFDGRDAPWRRMRSHKFLLDGALSQGSLAGNLFRSPSGRSLVYNADFGQRTTSFRSLHRKSLSLNSHGVGRKASRSSSAKKSRPENTVIEELLKHHPDAASVPDEDGTYPLALAVAAGKPWDHALSPLYDAYPAAFDGSDEDMCRFMQSSLLTALTSPDENIRKETINTISKMVPLWQNPDELIFEMCKMSKRCGNAGIIDSRKRIRKKNSQRSEGGEDDAESKGSNKDNGNDDNQEDELFAIEASMLEALSGALSNAKWRKSGDGDGDPCGGDGAEDDTTVSEPHIESAHLAMDAGKDMISHENEAVRNAAAKVIGSAVEILGDNVAISTVKEFMPENGRRTIHRQKSWTNELLRKRKDEDEDADKLLNQDDKDDGEDVSYRHGCASVCFRIFFSSVGCNVDAETLKTAVTFVKDLMIDEEAIVRQAACLAVGALLGQSIDNHHTILREVRSVVLKCMRTTEDAGVHKCLARGLITALRMKPQNGREALFLCKVGMPILDGALMLSMTASNPDVQRMFHNFLWLVLQIGEGMKGVDEYISLSEGENGRIMMSLVTKTLSKIEEVDDNW